MWQDIKNIYHLFQAILAAIYYRFPSRKITVIGVTGTDGKTTTTSLIYHILNVNKRHPSMVSTVAAIIDGKSYDTGFHVTTPSSFEVQKFLRAAVDAKSRYMVLETTSHALHQNRVFGIHFRVGVVTNVTHEHLDYHKTYDAYVKAKAKLLKISDIAIVNKDDESYELISKIKNQRSKTQSKDQKWISYGLNDNSDVNPDNFSFSTKLVGEYNQHNCLAAVAVCRSLGLSDEEIRRGIASFELPAGRMEIVYKKDFTVMIDFAHTPNGIEQVLKAIKEEIKTKGRIIHVFGSAGKRDTTKRPKMGEASAKYADVIIVTAEDPRGEPVDKISNEILSGITNYELRIKDGSILKIDDRQEAISRAIELANKGDFVFITGKGHEKSMNYGNREEPWNEYESVEKALQYKA